MTGADGPAAHLTDADIEAYWKGNLPGADEERVETHYLDCGDCRTRVEALEVLMHSLREASLTRAPGDARWPAWQLAAVFAILVVGAAWLLAALGRVPGTPRDGAVTTTRASHTPGGLATMIVSLAPPTRGQSGMPVGLSSDTKLVVFELDVREANPSAVGLDVLLQRPAGGVLLRLSGALPTDTGILRVPVDASVLTDGQYLFSVTAGTATVAIPFSIRHLGSE